MKATLALVLALSVGSMPAFAADSATSTMKNDIPSGFNRYEIKPEGRGFLNCRFLQPDDFKIADLPSETVDLDDPKRFVPLAVSMATYGPVVFTVAARPAYVDGAVSQWLHWLAKEEGYDPGAVEVIQIGQLSGVACDAIQAGDGITMRMRLVLIENGGRIFNLTAMAPTQLWSAAAGKLDQMIKSFELAQDCGSQVALMPVATVTSNEAAQALAMAQAGDAAETKTVGTQAKLSADGWAEVVLAADASTLDPEQKINANLRERGIGLVPNVLSVDDATKSARVGAGAIEAVFTIPFGWHVIDDGRRTLIFDGKNQIQINLNLRHWNDSPFELAREILQDYLQRQPGLKVVSSEYSGIAIVKLLDLKVDDEILDQTFLFRPASRPGMMLVARVTASRDDMRKAENLAGDILVRLETAEMLAHAQ